MRNTQAVGRVFSRTFSRAFSLAELLIVIVVMCILVAVLVKVPPLKSGMSVSIPTANGAVAISEGDFVRVGATNNPRSPVTQRVYLALVRQNKNGFGRDMGLMASDEFTRWFPPEEYRSKKTLTAFTVIRRGTDEHRETMKSFRPEYSSTPPK